jgi:exopolysaccharide production protein ExoZ
MMLSEGLGRGVPAWVGWAAPSAAFVICVTHAVNGPAGEFVQSAAFFALCAVCFRGDGRISACMTWSPLRWLGNMSYSYYLVHGFVVRIFMGMLARVLPTGLPDSMFWALMPTLYLATLLVSSMVFVMIEKPISLRPVAANNRKLVSS